MRRGIYGTPDNHSYSSGHQDVLIPAHASGGMLSFWCYPSQRALLSSRSLTDFTTVNCGVVQALAPLAGDILGYGASLLFSLWIVGPSGRASYLGTDWA